MKKKIVLTILLFSSCFTYADQVDKNTNNLVRIHLEIRDLKENNKTLTGELEAVLNKIEKLKKEIKGLSALLTHRKTTKKKQVKKEAKRSKNKNVIGDEELYENAKKALIKTDFKKSIKLFEKYLKRYPKSQNNLSAHYYLGKVYYYDKQYNKSIKYYDLFMLKSPLDKRVPKVIYSKYQVYTLLKNDKEVKKMLKDIVNRFPKSSYAIKAKKELKKKK